MANECVEDILLHVDLLSNYLIPNHNHVWEMFLCCILQYANLIAHINKTKAEQKHFIDANEHNTIHFFYPALELYKVLVDRGIDQFEDIFNRVKLLANLYSLAIVSVKKIIQHLTENNKVKPFNENKALFLKALQRIVRNNFSHCTPVAPYDVRISAPDLSILPNFNIYDQTPDQDDSMRRSVDAEFKCSECKNKIDQNGTCLVCDYIRSPDIHKVRLMNEAFQLDKAVSEEYKEHRKNDVVPKFSGVLYFFSNLVENNSTAAIKKTNIQTWLTEYFKQYYSCKVALKLCCCFSSVTKTYLKKVQSDEDAKFLHKFTSLI